MKLNKIVVGILSFFFSVSAFGQYCGNVANQSDIDRLIANRDRMYKAGITKSPDAIYVPVTFHIVRETDGSDGINEQRIISQLCALNNDYAAQNVTFYLKDKKFNYVNSTILFTNPTASSSNNKMIEQKLGAGANSMNVFICQNANTGGLGTTLGYYDPFIDVIVIRQADVNGTSGTLSHEAGHFFSLLHVHSGWDSEPWDAGDHGNPITNMFSPGGKLAELVDGSNCADAGDFLCDTPADYNLGFGWNGCTTYTGGCKDFDGVLLDPEEVNIMGYFIGCPEYNFSEEQQGVVKADFESSSRAYIRSNYIPNIEEAEQTELMYPIGGEVVNGYNYIQLDWKTMPNAIGYLVELRTGVTKTYYSSEKSDILLTDLQADKVYNWKILAYSETGGCGQYTSSESFRTGLNTGIEDLEEYRLNIYPTVVQDQTLNIEIAKSASVLVEVINVSGQKIQSNEMRLHKGANEFSLNSQVAQGMYFINLTIDNERKTFKVIVK